MTKKLNKLTSLLLALTLIFGVMSIAPFTVSAAGNSASTATTCKIGSNVSGNIQGFGRDDWYKFSTTSDGYVNISFSHDYVEEGLDHWDYWQMYLYNSDFEELGHWTFRGKEMKTIKCNNVGVSKGTYYAVVAAESNHSNLDYNFKISFTKSDYWEKELNNTINTANNIVADKTYSGTIKGYGDNDWYKVNFNTSGNVNISFNHDYVEDGLDHWEYWEMYLYNSSKESVGSWSYRGKEMKTITNRVSVNKGTYYIKITNSSEHSSLDYHFKLSTNAPTSVKLNKSSVTLGVGESYTLTKTVSPSNASTSYTWSSSKTSVATVNSSGKITAKGTGTANITVKTSNGKTATCKVTVKKAPSKVSLNKTSITLGVGETYDLNSSLPSGTASYSVKYSSNKSSVASVKSAGGLVTAKAVGTATITAKTFNGKTATCKVTVKKAPTSVSLNKTSITLKVGQTYDLNSKLPSGTASYSVKYTSNNTKVATVKAAGGLVTAKAKGTATITATTYNGKKATCKVTVK